MSKEKKLRKKIKWEIYKQVHPELKLTDRQSLETWYEGISKEKQYLSQRYKKYILAPNQYSTMLVNQDYRCAICKQYETAKTSSGVLKALSVDHCHSSNKIRGLLCHKCNIGLGCFVDSIENLQAAIAYLTHNKD